MRQILLAAIVVGICMGGLHTPIIGLFGYIWFALCRADYLAFSTWPFSIMLAIITMASSFRHMIWLPRLFSNPISFMLILQQIPVALSVVFALHIQLTTNPYSLYLRVVLMSLLIPLMVNSEEWLRRLLFVMICGMGITAVRMGVYSALISGGSLTSGAAGYYSDSNGLALAMTVLLPLAIYARTLTSNYILKLACLFIAVCAILTVVSCGSRGNSLACGVVLLLIIWRSKYKLVGLISAALLVLPALYFGGNRYISRIETITTYEEDSSASGRLEYWQAALTASLDYPVFGVGYGEENFQVIMGKYMGKDDTHVVHNTYLQALIDTGYPGFLLYTITIFGTIIWLGVSRRRMKKLKPEWVVYPTALQASLLGFAIASTFYSRQDFEFFYFVLMTAAAWHTVEKTYLTTLRLPRPVKLEERTLNVVQVR